MTQPTDLSGTGAPARYSRLGPSLSLLGAAFWVVTLAAYLLLMPEDALPGRPMRQATAMRLMLAFVIGALGIFASSIVSAVGLFLSLTERRYHPGSHATRGVVIGGLGVAALLLVVVEIFRLAFATTRPELVPVVPPGVEASAPGRRAGADIHDPDDSATLGRSLIAPGLAVASTKP